MKTTRVGDKVTAAGQLEWDDGPPYGNHVVNAGEVGTVVHSDKDGFTVDFGKGLRGDERVTLVLVDEVQPRD